MWWFSPPVHLVNGEALPATNVVETHLGRRWQRWSRHFRSGQWQSGVDGFGSFLTLIRQNLANSVPAMVRMTVTLVLPDQIAARLFKATAADIETACVVLARHVETPGRNIRLLARELHWVPDDAYLLRNATALSIASHGYVPALAAAEADQSVPIWLHTHPGSESTPKPSKYDETVDEQLADLFRLRSGSPFYGAIVLAQTGGRLCFTGHIESNSRRH